MCGIALAAPCLAGIRTESPEGGIPCFTQWLLISILGKAITGSQAVETSGFPTLGPCGHQPGLSSSFVPGTLGLSQGLQKTGNVSRMTEVPALQTHTWAFHNRVFLRELGMQFFREPNSIRFPFFFFWKFLPFLFPAFQLSLFHSWHHRWLHYSAFVLPDWNANGSNSQLPGGGMESPIPSS